MNARIAVSVARAAGHPFDLKLPELVAFKELSRKQRRGPVLFRVVQVEASHSYYSNRTHSHFKLHPIGFSTSEVITADDEALKTFVTGLSTTLHMPPRQGQNIWSLYGPKDGNPHVLPPSLPIIRQWIARRLLKKGGYAYPLEPLFSDITPNNPVYEIARYSVSISIDPLIGPDDVLLSASHLFAAIVKGFAIINAISMEGRSLAIRSLHASANVATHLIESMAKAPRAVSILDVAYVDVPPSGPGRTSFISDPIVQQNPTYVPSFLQHIFFSISTV